jgi:hypothetical protein
MMQVHRCTFEMALHSARVGPSLQRTTLQALWRTERGDIIVVGAMRPTSKKGIALFDENFRVQTELLLDPDSKHYHFNKVLLEIRRATPSLEQPLSAAYCRFNLA